MQDGFLGQRDERAGTGSGGTRFLIYPQAPIVTDYTKPEAVWIATPPDRLQPGPGDHRMYVRDAMFDKVPYEYPYLPPFAGETYAPATAAYDGHFDSLPVNSRQFVAAHAFACAARVLDIWESHLGHAIIWHFAETYERLEIIPLLDWDNAQSGYGYLELGVDRSPEGQTVPYALNFDVIAHEMGHAVVFSESGFPLDGQGGEDFAPIHEANADLISLLSFLHFDSAAERLLRHCNGNLLVLNELNRIGELVGDRQIRLASNSRRLSEVSSEVHDQSRPLTGAVFDCMVERFHEILVAQGLADERLLNVGIRDIDAPAMRRLSDLTTRAFRQRPFEFESALARARDEIAGMLARTWQITSADQFSFRAFAEGMMTAAESRSAGLARRMEINLAWRELL